jgi:hypothetical protein
LAIPVRLESRTYALAINSVASSLAAGDQVEHFAPGSGKEFMISRRTMGWQ